jgi:hypothetical protein
MYLGGLGAYYLKNGQPTSTYYVGETMGFNVPGYSQVWLTQVQNGSPQYNGPFNVPMPPYVLQSRDIGTFAATVYELTPQGKQGKLIGTDTVQVLATPQTIYAPPTIQTTLAPAYTQGAAPSSGSSSLPSGMSTPSAPAPSPTVVMSAPSGPIDFSTPYTPIDTGVIQEQPQQAGFHVLAMFLIAGAGLYFVFGGKRK